MDVRLVYMGLRYMVFFIICISLMIYFGYMYEFDFFCYMYEHMNCFYYMDEFAIFYSSSLLC